MAQTSLRFRILAVAGYNNATWTPVTAPFTGARDIYIYNPDGTLPVSVCTDTTDAASVISVAALANFLDNISPGSRAYAAGEILFYVKGAGAAPIVVSNV